jgi:hypothetical protein
MASIKNSFLIILVLITFSCSDELNGEFTGNEMTIPMISGEVEGNRTNGLVTIRERSDGKAQIELIVENVISNAEHPVHLHYGSLDDNGKIALFLNDLVEVNEIGKSITVLEELSDGELLNYHDLLMWNGSIKIHFESSGPLENALIASTNIGINQSENAPYLQGDQSITVCNSRF